MWSISTTIILILLTTISKLSFGESCEERLNNLEGVLKELISRNEKNIVLGDLVKNIVESTVTQQLEARWQRLEYIMKRKLEDNGISLEERLESTQDILGARLKRLEEILEGKSNTGIQNKLKLFEKQKTINEKLDARTTELEKKNSRSKIVFKDVEENQKFTASQINLNLPKTNMLQKGFENEEIYSKQFSSQDALTKSDSHFGERFANKTEKTNSPGIKAQNGEKSLEILVPKRDLSGMHPTKLPTNPPVPVHEIAAFSAYISVYETRLTEDVTLKFDRIVTNIGNHYNPYSGTFIAPQHGVYVFTWGLYCHTEGHIFSQLVVNSNSVGATYTSSEGSRNIRITTGMVVVEVNVGDVVFVRTHPTRPNAGSIYSGVDFRSTFSGWKLY